MAIASINILDHLFAAFMLKININVGRFLALLADEALKKKINLHRINCGYSQCIADGRVCGRTTPLTQNIFGPCESHNVMHGQKILGDIHFRDEIKLALDAVAHIMRQHMAITLGGASPGEIGQLLLCSLARRNGFVWIIIFNLIEGEIDQTCKTDGFANGFWNRLEKLGHFLW